MSAAAQSCVMQVLLILNQKMISLPPTLEFIPLYSSLEQLTQTLSLCLMELVYAESYKLA
jgi:hypothetical protein